MCRVSSHICKGNGKYDWRCHVRVHPVCFSILEVDKIVFTTYITVLLEMDKKYILLSSHTTTLKLTLFYMLSNVYAFSSPIV